MLSFLCLLHFFVHFEVSCFLFGLDCGTKKSKKYLGFSGPHSNSQALGVGGSALKAGRRIMADNNQSNAGSGQQQQGTGQSGQQGASIKLTPEAEAALTNLVGSFLAAGFEATVIPPKKEDKATPAA